MIDSTHRRLALFASREYESGMVMNEQLEPDPAFSPSEISMTKAIVREDALSFFSCIAASFNRQFWADIGHDGWEKLATKSRCVFWIAKLTCSTNEGDVGEGIVSEEDICRTANFIDTAIQVQRTGPCSITRYEHSDASDEERRRPAQIHLLARPITWGFEPWVASSHQHHG